MTRPEIGAHEGPCLNYEGQDPGDYTGYDSCYLHIQASDRWLEQVWAIVTDLASSDAPMSDMGCTLCDAPWTVGAGTSALYTSGHSTDCPWRRAVEFTRESFGPGIATDA